MMTTEGVEPLEPSTLQLRFAPLVESLRLTGPSAQAVRHVAEVEVRLACPDGTTERGRAHLTTTVGVISLPLRCVGAAEGGLTVEVTTSGGQMVALGALPGGAFAASAGVLRLALLCPDALCACGTLELSYLRADGRMSVPATSGTTPRCARVVPAGLLATGELARAPGAASLGATHVSRTALWRAPAATPANGEGGAVCLELCVGRAELPGGAADLNALATASVAALGCDDVVGLATADLGLAALLRARAPEAPLVWCGGAGVARRLRVASIHDEGPAVLRAARDGDHMLLPEELYGNRCAKPRRQRSVNWADPLVPESTVGAA